MPGLCPQKAPCFRARFPERLLTLCKKRTGAEPEREKQVCVERYDKGGISQGLESSRFWIERPSTFTEAV